MKFKKYKKPKMTAEEWKLRNWGTLNKSDYNHLKAIQKEKS